MALSEIKIYDFIQHQTKELIVRSDYTILRKYLLDRIAIDPVIQEINATLQHHYLTDVQSMIQELTYLACESQKEQDLKDAKIDEQEQTHDQVLQSKYNRELTDLPGKKLLVESQISQQANSVKLFEEDLSVLNKKLDLINKKIDRAQDKIRTINIQYPYNTQVQNIHGHPNTMVVNPYFTQINPRKDTLINKVDRLNDKKQSLEIKIEGKTNQIANERRSLSALNQKIRQLETHNKELSHQLDVVLPDKMVQRQTRSQERSTRELARKGYAPNIQQLSEENRSKLTQKINIKTAELEGTKNKLQIEAINSSYSFFVTQLQEVLEQNPLQIAINHQEKIALVSITKSMIEFIQVEKAMQETNASLNKLKAKLGDLQNQLKESNQLLQKDISSNEQLKLDNIDRNTNIEQLKPEKKSATQKAVIALCCCLLGAIGAAATAAIIITLIINPIFYAIVGALALMAIIALPFTIHHFKQKSNLNEAIENHLEDIDKNNSKILRQEKEAINLQSSTIPQLKSQLQETEQLISRDENQLEFQRVKINQLIDSTNYIMPSNFHAHRFFSNDTIAPQQPPMGQVQSPYSQFGL